MLSLDATQLAIVASAYKKASWLLTVVDADAGTAGPTTYYWSTITRSYDGHDYVYKIDPKSFKGITLNRASSELGIQVPNDLSFIIENSGNTLTASNFIDGTVTLDLVISDGTNESTICIWKFNIKRCEAAYQTLEFTCEDFIQKYLEGDYPNTKLVKDISVSDDPDIDINDNICVPIPFGLCYIPLRSIYITDQRYYLLGPESGKTYTISKVRSPRKWGAKSEWDSGSYSFTQSTKTIDTVAWRVFQAIIADSDNDGSADANGLWKEGEHFLDMPTKFVRDDTKDTNGNQTGSHDGANNAAILTDTGAAWGIDKLIGSYVVNRTDGSYGKITDNTATTVIATLAGGTDNDWDIGDNYTIGGPASVIKFILEDIGVLSSDIDDTSFAIAEKIFAGWGLTFIGAFWYKQSCDKVLAQLLNMCHSTLKITDKIELHVLSKTSQKTATKADVLRTSEVGAGTFKYSLITQKQSDSGYIAFQEAGESQDEFIKALVPAKATTNNISSSILEIPFVQDSQDVQRIGTLKYQREFLKKANISFINKGGTLLALQPDDVMTINHADYGGNYAILIDSITINHDLTIDFNCIQFSVALDDWGDLSPGAITVATDDSSNVWNPVISGPPGNASSGGSPNALKGSLLISSAAPYTNQILIDPADPIIKLKEGATERLLIGKLAANEYGIRGNDASGNLLFKIDTSGAEIAGWTINQNTLANSTNIILDASNKKISIKSATFGNDGIQLDYNAGNPRVYIGDGANQFFKFDGTNISWKGVNSELTTGGTFDLYYPSSGSFELMRFFDVSSVKAAYVTCFSSIFGIYTYNSYNFDIYSVGTLTLGGTSVLAWTSTFSPVSNNSCTNGTSIKKWSDVWTVLQHTGDILFSDTHCHICKKRFKKGDSLILTVIDYLKNKDGDEIDCIPIHLHCAKEEDYAIRD